MSSIPSNAFDLSLMNTFFDLYAIWFSMPTKDIYEAWDNTGEAIATTVIESLQLSMYFTVIGPTAFAVPSMTFAQAFRRLEYSNPNLLQLFSAKSVSMMMLVAEYLLKLVSSPQLPAQRANVLLNSPLANLPWSLLLASHPHYLTVLENLLVVFSSVVDNGLLLRLAFRFLLNLLPDTGTPEAPNPSLLHQSFDADTLPVIMELVLYGLVHLPCPFTAEETELFANLHRLPWARLPPHKMPTFESSPSPLKDLFLAASTKIPALLSRHLVLDLSSSAAPPNQTATWPLRAFQALAMLRSIAHLPSFVDPKKPSCMVGPVGLEINSEPNLLDWTRSPSEAFYFAGLTARIFETQSALVASCLEESSVVAVFAAMLSYLEKLSTFFYNMSTSSQQPPMEMEVRLNLAALGVPTHVPDSVAYRALWAHMLNSIASAILKLLNHRKILAQPDANVKFEQKLLSSVSSLLQAHPLLSNAIIAVAMSSVKSGTVATRLLEPALQVDWNFYRSFMRLCDMLQPPLNYNVAQLRQDARVTNSVLLLTVLAHQTLIRPDNLNELTGLEPELLHWCTSLTIVPGRECDILALWFKAVQCYVVLLSGRPSGMIQDSRTTDRTASNLLAIAKHIYIKSDEKMASTGAFLNFFGVTKASEYAPPFRVAARLLALFLFEHLLETPVIGPGNKIIGSSVTVRQPGMYVVKDEVQDKRKAAFVESTTRSPLSEFSSQSLLALDLINSSSKSLPDVIELWPRLVTIFQSPWREQLQSLL